MKIGPSGLGDPSLLLREQPFVEAEGGVTLATFNALESLLLREQPFVEA